MSHDAPARRNDAHQPGIMESLSSRRVFLKRTVLLAASAPVFASLIAACADTDDDDAPATDPDTETDDEEVEADDEADEPDADDEDVAEVADEQAIVIVDGVEPDYLTPMTATTAQHSISALYEALVEFDEDVEIQPTLATSWEVSEDGLVWTFDLREGVLFHNGVELTSADVQATIDYIQDTNVPAPRRGNYALIDEVDTSEPYVATIHTSSVNLDFPFLMADGSAKIINAEHLAEVSYEYDRDPVGTGPYRLVEWTPNEIVRLERFDDYWGELPEITTHIFRPIVEFSTRVVVMRTGEADIAFNIPPADVAELNAVDGVTVHSKPGLTVHMIELKVSLGPLSDPMVRRALNMAIDKQGIIDNIMHGYADPLLTPGVPGLWGTVEFDPIPYDPDGARELLADAGYPDGFQLQDLVYFSGQWPGDDETVEAVQGYWANIGVQMGIERRDFAGFVDALTYDPMEYEGLPIMPIRSSIYNDYHLYRMFHTDATHAQAAQRSGYSNPEVDRLLDAQRAERDEDARLEMLAEIQRLIWEDQPFIFLFHRHNVWAVRDDLEGYYIHPANHFVPHQVRRV
jgi:peptide/nickel transport system substrate-binding protein